MDHPNNRATARCASTTFLQETTTMTPLLILLYACIGTVAIGSLERRSRNMIEALVLKLGVLEARVRDHERLLLSPHDPVPVITDGAYRTMAPLALALESPVTVRVSQRLIDDIEDLLRWAAATDSAGAARTRIEGELEQMRKRIKAEVNRG
jgi:hypothetical protein